MPPIFYLGFSGLGRLLTATSSTLASFGCLLLPDFSGTNLSYFTMGAMVSSGCF